MTGTTQELDAAEVRAVLPAALPVGRAGEFGKLWHDAKRYVRQVEALPQTLCHLNLHPGNTFDVPGGETVLTPGRSR